MRIDHPAATSAVFELLRVLEFDLVVLGDRYPARFEVFRNTESPKRFRVRLWERNLYHLKPTLNVSGIPSEEFELEYSDEELMVERTWELSERFEDFEAEDEKDAIHQALTRLEEYLASTSNAERSGGSE